MSQIVFLSFISLLSDAALIALIVEGVRPNNLPEPINVLLALSPYSQDPVNGKVDGNENGPDMAITRNRLKLMSNGEAIVIHPNFIHGYDGNKPIDENGKPCEPDWNRNMIEWLQNAVHSPQKNRGVVLGFGSDVLLDKQVQDILARVEAMRASSQADWRAWVENKSLARFLIEDVTMNDFEDDETYNNFLAATALPGNRDLLAEAALEYRLRYKEPNAMRNMMFEEVESALKDRDVEVTKAQISATVYAAIGHLNACCPKGYKSLCA